MGYHHAGFDDIVGVDINSQPRYPFTFIQGDALEYIAAHGVEFDAIHASPPCQGYSSDLVGLVTKDYPMLIAPTRELMIETGKPWVIENVRPKKSTPNDHRLNGIILCGSAFGMRLWRHRWFDASFPMLAPTCQHHITPLNPYKQSSRARDGITGTSDPLFLEVMGIPWMKGKEASEAIPPAYTEYVGRELIKHLGFAA